MRRKRTAQRATDAVTAEHGDSECRTEAGADQGRGNGESRLILFIDEIHLVLGAGRSSDGGMDAANLLKPPLARGELRCIGTTTLGEYRKYIEKDAAFERRFQQVYVGEASVSRAMGCAAETKAQASSLSTPQPQDGERDTWTDCGNLVCVLNSWREAGDGHYQRAPRNQEQVRDASQHPNH